MLSIENPPPDPSQLSSDERASHTQFLPLPEVDLPNPPHTPLPNFSIRDYVFTSRSKDIKKNWPFSLKNLQLCLKHGVKDVLPPFQALDSVRNQSVAVETSSLDEKPYKPDNKDTQLNNKPFESCTDISSCRSVEENDFPSTTTSVSQSEIESLANNKQSEKSRPSSVAVETASPSGNNKTESISRPPPSKKCRLIVKFGGTCDRSSTEDIASNCTTASETMASKVCPVCKTFSSSSNTTLNAHIDQCLSMESTPKWTADSKSTRHRIKPRKMRLMVDVYSTALPCTLEDLDRRNGTNWATVSSLPVQETEKIENSNEPKIQRVSSVHPEDAADVGPVYIDANGTKLRILSNFNQPTPLVSKVGEYIGARKRLKGVKGSKYISKKKKKRLAQKHHKYLKLAPQTKKLLSHEAHGSQISEGQEGYDGEAKTCEKEHVPSKQSQPIDSGTLRPWVCSKRRGFGKKVAGQEANQSVRCNWHLSRDLLVENTKSALGNSIGERNHVQKFTSLSENPTSSGNSERVEKSFHRVQVINKRDKISGRKRVGEYMTSDRVEGSLPPLEQNSNQLGNIGNSVHDSCMLGPLNSTKHASLPNKKKVETRKDSLHNSDFSCIRSTKSSRSTHAIVTKAMKFSSFRKNILSLNGRSSVTEPIPSKIKKWSALKKSQVHLMKKRDEEAVTWNFEARKKHDLLSVEADRERDDDEYVEGSTVLEPRQMRGHFCAFQGDEALALRSSKSAPQCYDHDASINADASGDDFLTNVNCSDTDSPRKHVCVYVEDIAVEPSSRTSDGRSSTSLIKSVESEVYKLCNSSKVHSSFLLSVEDYRGLLCDTGVPTSAAKTDFVHDQEMFSADEVGNDLNRENADMGLELDSEAGQGNSFPGVDPIPIPGPPGSFLPSPRDMGSEDFQGNSSLTTSRIHSSPDQHDVVDRDSSGSPMSAASTVSNSTAGRSDFNYSEPSSAVGPYAIQDKSRSTSASFVPSVQNVDDVPLPTVTQVESTISNGECLKLDRIYIEKGSLSFKNDQPCCCQRKERFSQGVALNYQESQLLRRRKMAPVTVSAVGKHVDFISNIKAAELDVRPELATANSCGSSVSEKVVLPAVKPLAGPVLFKESPNAATRVSARNDSDYASPSASNPVLRLMGKDLMVVNKEDDTPVPLAGFQPRVQNNSQASEFLSFSRVFPGNDQNQDSHHMASQASAFFSQNLSKSVGPCFDGGLSNGFRSQSDSGLPVHARLPAGLFQNQHPDCGFSSSMECHDFNISARHNRLKNKLNLSPSDNNMENHYQRSDSSANLLKEIIIIDDNPESENVVSCDVANYTEGLRERQVVSSGISIPSAPNYNPSFACYQSQDPPLLGEPPMMRNASFHAAPSKLGNACPVRWGCTADSSGLVQRSSFTAASSSPARLRSAALHYTPGFS